MISKAVNSSLFVLHLLYQLATVALKYLVYQVFDNLGYQFFLHRGKALSGVVGLGRCKLLFEVLGMVLGVGETYVYGDTELGLC